jgi:alkylation response protein AidB-like acyl-CoA dehydrogenase
MDGLTPLPSNSQSPAPDFSNLNLNPSLNPEPAPNTPEQANRSELENKNLSESPDDASRAIVEKARAADAPVGAAPVEAPKAEDKSKGGMLEETARAFGRDLHEARSLDKVDKADMEADKHYAGKGTSDSPAFKAVWGKNFPSSLFFPETKEPSEQCLASMQKCCDVLKDLRDSGKLFGPDNKVSPEALESLGKAGYWGMLISPEFGGQGASFHAFTRFLTNMAKIDPSTAGLSSVHGCIGAVDPLIAFGNPQQQAHYLPLLASGQKLSGFALTEPGAGSDLTAVRTKAELVGDKYLVTGEKLFITNVGPGRTVGLVCLIDNKPAVLVVDLPEKDSAQFRFKDYGLHALSHVWNRGMVFDKFEVPKENLLDPTKGGTMKGDGLTIAYHGLNRGRIALCANAGGTISGLLAEVLPWAERRITYAKAIGERQLVRSRLGHMATQAVGCEAISTWCAKLLDQGFRGELECIVAKNFGSEAQKTVVIEDYMKTHGGRSFLKGHNFGDNVHDLLAPLIYEGEGDMLSMGFLKSLIKDHAENYFAPIADKVNQLKSEGKLRKDFDPGNGKLTEMWKLRKEAFPYAMWVAKNKIGAIWEKVVGTGDKLPADMPKDLKKHLAFAAKGLRGMVGKIDDQMRKYGPALQDEQCMLVDLSKDTQNLLMMAVVACWGSEQKDPVMKKAAGLLCEELKVKVTGGRLGSRYHKGLASLGRDVIEGKFTPIEGLAGGKILQPYDGLKKKD